MNNQKFIQLPLPLWSAMLITYTLALVTILLGIWQMSIIAAVVGGYCVCTGKKSILTGMLGISLAWGSYMVLYLIRFNTQILLNQITEIILGFSNGFWMILLGIFLIALILGILGGLFGYHLKKIIQQVRKKSKENQNQTDIKDNN